MSNQSVAAKVQANLQELFKSNLAPGNAYIKFQLTADIAALLSMERVQESLIVKAEQITTLPSMPKSAIGMISSRDRVFCIFDLAQLLTLPSKLITPRQYQIIVLQTVSEPSIYIGLAVTQLQGIIRFPSEKILSSLDSFDSKITSYLSGSVKEKKINIPIFDFDAIMSHFEHISINN